jgi:hypothetical protein
MKQQSDLVYHRSSRVVLHITSLSGSATRLPDLPGTPETRISQVCLFGLTHIDQRWPPLGGLAPSTCIKEVAVLDSHFGSAI